MPTLSCDCRAHSQVAVVSPMPASRMCDSMFTPFFLTSTLNTDLPRQNKGPTGPQEGLRHNPKTAAPWLQLPTIAWVNVGGFSGLE